MTTTHTDSINVPALTSGRRARRWRAVGAALAIGAISIGSISAWQVNASSEHESSFVPTAPCRLFDTRPGTDPSGGKKSPLGPGESNVHTQQVTGTIGNCQVPTDAVAVSMNVTAVNGTAQSNLRVYPADVATPTASNLNWVARQSPTPNKVDVQLSPAGAIKLYNHNGTIDVLADVVGYYTPSALHEMRARLRQLESRVDESERSKPFIESATSNEPVEITPSPLTMLELDVLAPVDGQVAIAFSARALVHFTNELVACEVYKKPEVPFDFIATDPGSALEEGGAAAADETMLNGTKVVSMRADERVTFSLVCQGGIADAGFLGPRVMTATFIPS